MALFVGDPSAPTRFGTEVADTSDETGLFLKIFGGEVFAAFSETTIMIDKHFVREINSGKSAQFPKTWKVSAAYHTAGQEMLGQDTDETERVISIDGLLVSVQESGHAQYYADPAPPASAEWKTATIPLADFRFGKWSKDENDKLDPDQINRFCIGVHGGAKADEASGRILVKDIQFVP